MGLEERPAVLAGTDSYRASRPEIVGPEVPQKPFPILLSGVVQRGFGRGGKDLGCPTGTCAILLLERPRLSSIYLANLPDESITPMSSVTQTGVYYGYAQVSADKDGKTVLAADDGEVHPMVMSLGWNPFYKNERMSAVSSLNHYPTS